MLTDTIPNPIGVPTIGGMSRKLPSSILRSKAPTSLMEVAKAVCQAPLFSAKTLAISSIQLVVVFCLVATLYENGGIPKVMVTTSRDHLEAYKLVEQMVYTVKWGF